MTGQVFPAATPKRLHHPFRRSRVAALFRAAPPGFLLRLRSFGLRSFQAEPRGNAYATASYKLALEKSVSRQANNRYRSGWKLHWTQKPMAAIQSKFGEE